MRELIPSGSLREMLLPPTYGRHITPATEFTVLSIEIWDTGLVVTIHLATEDTPVPRIILQDHFGTEYSLQESATLGPRNLQVFTPSVPEGTRSLTVRSADDPDGSHVVTFAVPLRAVPKGAAGQSAVPKSPHASGNGVYPPPPDLRRPA